MATPKCITETYRPLIPIHYSKIGTSSFECDALGRRLNVRAERNYGFDFVVRQVVKRPLEDVFRKLHVKPIEIGSKEVVRIYGKVEHDGKVHELTLQYPSNADGWTSQCINRLWTIVGFAEFVEERKLGTANL